MAAVLLEKIIAEAKSLGYTVIRLHASAMGKPLYSRYGFIESEGFMHLSE
ncbi:hypothetical protein JFL75_11890 [Breznakiella homolactica]|uniref:N-acetyltransferase domain-containing protein n=1 Tax=Breznakiella homolactica TaxID=2798577 RepID=A0A7T7XS36_9SPIR|nr:hypothetical protein JFL75_11890 [Breznakiella homolactica]